MLANITWTEFLTTLGGLIVVYYLVIIYIFYKENIIKRFRKNNDRDLRHIFIDKDFNPLAITQEANKEEETAYDIHDRVEYLMEMTKETLYKEAVNHADKAALLNELSQLFQKFNDLKGTPFIPAVHEFIIKELKTYGKVALEEEDLEACWE